jgi:hypothetical protein
MENIEHLTSNAQHPKREKPIAKKSGPAQPGWNSAYSRLFPDVPAYSRIFPPFCERGDRASRRQSGGKAARPHLGDRSVGSPLLGFARRCSPFWRSAGLRPGAETWHRDVSTKSFANKMLRKNRTATSRQFTGKLVRLHCVFMGSNPGYPRVVYYEKLFWGLDSLCPSPRGKLCA